VVLLSIQSFYSGFNSLFNLPHIALISNDVALSSKLSIARFDLGFKVNISRKLLPLNNGINSYE
jgi:hypothetical protein